MLADTCQTFENHARYFCDTALALGAIKDRSLGHWKREQNTMTITTLFAAAVISLSTVNCGENQNTCSIEYNHQQDAVVQLKTAIEKEEIEDGAFGLNMAGLYLELGHAQLSQQRVAEAMESFHRGLHIERVNNGLHSLDQVQFLQALAEVESYNNEWDKAKEYHQQIYALQSAVLGDNDMLVAETLMDLGRLYLNRFENSSEEQSIETLYQSLAVIKKASMIAKANNNANAYRVELAQASNQLALKMNEKGLAVSANQLLLSSL